MASADLNAVLTEYNGTNLQQLIKKYNLKNDDIAKLRQLNAKIDKELGVKDGAQPLPDSKEITLDDGTKVLAAQVRTVNQPKGGKVNVYMAQDGKQYYQYVDANGKQQKITKTWDHVSANLENFTSAVGKIADGHPIDGVVQMFSGAEDPRGLITGEAPIVGFAKGSGLLSKLKDVKKWGGSVKSFAKGSGLLSKLKDVKKWGGSVKSFAKNFVQKFKPTSALKKTNVSYNISQRPDGIWQGAITTNKDIRTIEGKIIPAGSEIMPHGSTWQFSKVKNGRLILDVKINGKPEVITCNTTLTSDLVFKGPGYNYIENDIPVIAEALNSIP